MCAGRRINFGDLDSDEDESPRLHDLAEKANNAAARGIDLRSNRGHKEKKASESGGVTVDARGRKIQGFFSKQLEAALERD